MEETEDYELYDKDFDEWVRLGRESFGFETDVHPGDLDVVLRNMERGRR